ncbi:hypothetical protein BY458DRAFT_507678 [Sporodiniella umbellata]|nr:hypothetical protein BY458DRAFT_507678 [Sporodiniella umbellata]
MSKAIEIPLETTPKVYDQNYIKPDPCYDLYPSLARRLNNGFSFKSNQAQTASKKDFITMNIPYVRRLDFIEDPFWEDSEELRGQWDLYPGVLRSIANFGTDEMRQRLRQLETTLTTD